MAKHTVLIGDALTEGAALLVGCRATEDEIQLIDAAFAMVGHKRPSDDLGECSRELMKIMSS